MAEDAMPALPLAAASSTLQLVQFAIICMLVNIAMHALHSGTLMELCLRLHDTLASVLWVVYTHYLTIS
jgi:hypothetical protein